MLSNNFKQLGFTLLELLLVLVICSSIMLLSIKQYLQYKRQADFKIIKANVELLFNSLNIYYHLYCRSNSNPPFNTIVSMQELANHQLLPYLTPTSLVKSQQEYSYQVSANYLGTDAQSKKPIYSLTVSADLNTSAKNLAYYQQLLNATSINGDYISWTRLPSYTSGTSNNLWLSTTGLSYFKNSVVGLSFSNNKFEDNSCGI